MGHVGKKLKGWFGTAGRPGDRTLESQLKGLDLLLDSVKGKTVLDAGCAEGLLSIEFARRGALAVHGVEVREDHVKVGRGIIAALTDPLPVTLEAADLNTWAPRRDYDIVVALAILHKLKDPSEVALRLADACNDLLVLRMPPRTGMTVVDDRSGGVPHHIAEVLVATGLTFVTHNYDGPFGEYVAYWKRAQ